MTNKKLPKGFVPVMLTPFKSDKSIDFEALAQLTKMYIRAGAKGLFANCLSSEMYELSNDERLALVETVVKTTNGQIPVVATGTLGGTIEEMADFSIKLYEKGVDAVIVINTILVEEKQPDSLFIEKIKQFMSLTSNIPLGIYECPVPYKRLINKNTLENLLLTGRLIYYKDTSLDIDLIKERIKIGEAYDFGIYDAYMVNAIASLKAGAMGLSCIQGNYFPELVVWLCDNFENKKIEEKVQRVQQFFIDNMDIMHHVYPISAKYVLQKRGINISLTTRREVGVLTVKLKRNLDLLIENHNKLVADIFSIPAPSPVFAAI